ncbi:helix-turn-helix domain-containing protein [Streptomyces flavofungini]|uniref:helix-turn-helix domain-containing protein n=1 Tax=Streptomyces flavofungini TaxID=68200 RepID=UPI0025B1EF6A|nr:hypothetical protein [Streptomyces flavofungini]WJV50900.1 hypothetical protein QUY26_38570 [Streptomyces flavofungini]
MSTSTLHRYCNGDAVPADFRPVERFARLCGATPEELVEVHRRWILADTDRGRKTEPPAVGAPARTPKREPTPQREPAPQPEPESDPEAAPGPEPVTASAPPPPSRRRRNLVLAASVAAVLAVGSVALANERRR